MSTPPTVDLQALKAAFSEKCTKSSNVCFNNSRIYEAGFQATKPKNEDKTVFLESKLGLMVALFDGHFSDELSEYASQTLPALLCARIETTFAENGCSLGDAVTESLIKGIEDYDRSLLEDGVINEFPEKEQTDWSDPMWRDHDEVWLVLGWLREHPKFQRARYAVVGTTALVAFIDKAKENVWVASLGDSDAFLGQKSLDGSSWDVTRLSDFHNGNNPREVERLEKEHPGEPPVIRYGRVLENLAVTRALGNHQLKTPLPFARHILGVIWPAPYISDFFDKAVVAPGHTSPPYISATPTVCHHSLKPGDILILSSDGLAYELREFSEEDKLLAVISLAAASLNSLPSRNTVWSEKLGHGFIASAEGDNPAERLIENVCFGTNLEQMAEAVKPSQQWDDISSLVLFL
ncbi:phosphatase 2C-like domain-containing protein [Rhodocollybia butyracea]|uniref:Phosphatase 2C-like domain-containing protein n=1 Tax=Rhodocollybia butyracea TaxID=206335 RepID=A0A9P5U7I4_9AGAR|nr:phosphatase 2C-like domain-containing protein [Rhodocollybia butyracea]